MVITRRGRQQQVNSAEMLVIECDRCRRTYRLTGSTLLAARTEASNLGTGVIHLATMSAV
jgi:hypothetical protein